MILGELKLICTTINLLQELDVNTMLRNEGIEMNVVVFYYLHNTVVSTAVVIQHTHHLRRSVYIESHINVGT